MNALLTPPIPEDLRLVQLHLAGDATAFRQIVERHQGLVCAVAYSACGDVGRSEELAQEAFVAAWKQMPELREPARLRGWLCAITRNLARSAVRRSWRTPTAQADELSPETPAEAPDPREQAMGSDQAALLWSTLAEMPENYREPMVLFYREHRSIESVAAALELSEETVRQRLARGRAMLSERMAKLVEETLERSAPSARFASLVMLSLPTGLSPVMIEAVGGGGTAKVLTAAGTAGGAVVKGGVVFKFLAGVAFLPALLHGVEDFIRFNDRNAAQTDAGMRRQAAKAYLAMNAGIGLMVLGFLILPNLDPKVGSLWIFGLVGLCAVTGIWVSVRANCRMKAIQGQTATVERARGFERRSSGMFLGLPFYHVRLGTRPARRAPAVKGWIAISDGRAVGGLFAFGPFAVAPVSMGILGVGVISVSVAALGLMAALGIAAAGWWSAGLAAAGGFAAKGIWAVAPQFTSGASAWAAHAGDAAAKAFFHAHWFYRFTSASAWVLVWAGVLGWVMPVMLTAWQLWRTRPARSV